MVWLATSSVFHPYPACITPRPRVDGISRLRGSTAISSMSQALKSLSPPMNSRMLISRYSGRLARVGMTDMKLYHPLFTCKADSERVRSTIMVIS